MTDTHDEEPFWDYPTQDVLLGDTVLRIASSYPDNNTLEMMIFSSDETTYITHHYFFDVSVKNLQEFAEAVLKLIPPEEMEE